VKTARGEIKRITGAWRLPPWLIAAVKIDAARKGVPTHRLVESILTRHVSAESKRQAKEPAATT
jgi:predicted DNA binding CopG/RHH family protein